MYYVIADILDAGGIAAARETLAGAKFVDGRATAGWHAKLVKNNLQASGADKAVADLRETLAAKIGDHQLFRLAARPKALTPLILSRYEPGMEYGTPCRRRADERHAHRRLLHALPERSGQL